MRLRELTTTAFATTLAATTAFAQTSTQDALSGHTLLGINRDSGELVRYRFETGDASSAGFVTDADGNILTDIDAAGYAPDYQNILALWTDNATGFNKLLYVDVVDAHATVVADDLEGGRFTGAEVVATDTTCILYAVQHAKVKEPADISGECNINPSNGNNNEFEMTAIVDGLEIGYTRDDLHDFDAEGVFYEGACSYFRVKPKGNGNQNSLMLDGEPFTMQNSNTYSFYGDMTVRVWNDHIKNGKAMGHWWIAVLDGTANLNDDVELLSPNRLCSIDHLTGVVTEMVTLSRGYYGLATTDGSLFYTVDENNNLYVLDPSLETETLIASTDGDLITDLSNCGDMMVSYDRGSFLLGNRSEATGERETTFQNFGLGTVSPIMLVPDAQVYTSPTAMFD